MAVSPDTFFFYRTVAAITVQDITVPATLIVRGDAPVTSVITA
jgi:hypothetical protein